jgi:hypothetical protein
MVVNMHRDFKSSADNCTVYLRIHDSGKGRIVAVCDENLIGRVFDDGKACLDLDRYRGFYVGEKAGGKEVREALGKFSSANIVGKESVAVAVSMGLAAEDDVMYIKRTPYIQIYRI